MPEEAQMHAAGELRLADAIRFQYFHALGRNWLFALIFLGMLGMSLLGILVVGASGDPEKYQNPGVLWLIQMFFAFATLTLPYWNAKKQLATQVYLREPMRFVTTEEGIALHGPNFSSEVNWTLVQAVYETNSQFLIYTAPQVAWILPKRFFWGEERRMVEWKQLAMRRLGARYHKPGAVAARL